MRCWIGNITHTSLPKDERRAPGPLLPAQYLLTLLDVVNQGKWFSSG